MGSIPLPTSCCIHIMGIMGEDIAEMSREILRIEHVSKDFFGNRVLNDINLEIKAGEIVSLVGENGAGKSTLMNILFGMDVIQSTGGFEGKLFFEGKEIHPASPNDAIELGIGMVHQEFKLIDDFSIAENIKLNKENCKNSILTGPFGGKLDLLDKEAMGKDAREALDRVKLSVDEWASVAGLSVAKRQFVEIAKALDSKNTKLLIFDEPTAVLTEKESNDLLDIMLTLSQKGISCLFISHKLEEVIRVSDKIAVLRDGEIVGTYNRGTTTAEELARVMVGRDVLVSTGEARDMSAHKVLLSLRNFEVDMPSEQLRGIDLDVYEGEILGIAGLAGSGKLSISNGIRGLYETRGEALFDGEKLDTKRTKRNLQKGIAFVSEDRKKVGLVLEDSIEDNCIYGSMISRNLFLKKKAGIRMLNREQIKTRVRELLSLLEVKCVNEMQKVGSLSGGNQQKVCIASMLLQEPKLFFASEPTRGIDIGAKHLILTYIRKLNREQNVTVVMTSSELHELRTLCDRIAVISDGKLAGILPADAPIEEFGPLMANLGHHKMNGEA